MDGLMCNGYIMMRRANADGVSHGQVQTPQSFPAAAGTGNAARCHAPRASGLWQI